METALSAYKNHENSVTHAHSICKTMFENEKNAFEDHFKFNSDTCPLDLQNHVRKWKKMPSRTILNLTKDEILWWVFKSKAQFKVRSHPSKPIKNGIEILSAVWF